MQSYWLKFNDSIQIDDAKRLIQMEFRLEHLCSVNWNNLIYAKSFLILIKIVYFFCFCMQMQINTGDIIRTLKISTFFFRTGFSHI